MHKPATIKGTIIQGIFLAIEQRHGKTGSDLLLSGLTPEQRVFLDQGIKSDTRVPADILCALYETIKHQWGGEQGHYYSEIMQEIAEHNINTFLKFLISFGLPSFVANSVSNVYNYYFDQGRVVMVSSTRNSVEFYIKNGEPYGEALCSGIIGWGIKGLQMANASQIRVEHEECIYKGKKRCYFKVRWGSS